MKLTLSPPLREAALPPTAMGAWTVPHEWWDEGHGCQPCPDTGRLEGKGNRVSPLRMAAFQGNAVFFCLKKDSCRGYISTLAGDPSWQAAGGGS